MNQNRRNFTIIILMLTSVTLGSMSAFATLNEKQLLKFWDGNPNFSTVLAVNNRAELRRAGVDDVNLLVPYLDSQTYQKIALQSMLLMAFESKPLQPDTMMRLQELLQKNSQDLLIRASVMRLKALYPNNDFGLEFQISPLDYYQLLDEYGELAARDEKERERAKMYVKTIFTFFKTYARGGMPAEGRDVPLAFISAIRWNLYTDPDLAKSCAEILLGRMKPHLPFRLTPVDFKPAVEFLLYQSAADPDFLTQNLAELCCDDADLASALLWVLNESKDTSPIAKKVLAKFTTECKQNQQILQAIQAGKISKEDAFDKALERLYPKH